MAAAPSPADPFASCGRFDPDDWAAIREHLSSSSSSAEEKEEERLVVRVAAGAPLELPAGRVGRVMSGTVVLTLPDAPDNPSFMCGPGSFLALDTVVGREAPAGLVLTGAEKAVTSKKDKKEKSHKKKLDRGGAKVEFANVKLALDSGLKHSVAAKFFLEAAAQLSAQLRALPAALGLSKQKHADAKKASGDAAGDAKDATDDAPVLSFPGVKRVAVSKKKAKKKPGRLDVYQTRVEHVNQVFGFKSRRSFPLQQLAAEKTDEHCVHVADDKYASDLLFPSAAVVDTFLAQIASLKKANSEKRTLRTINSSAQLTRDTDDSSGEKDKGQAKFKADWKAILEHAQHVCIEEGNTLCRAGDEGNRLFQISSGTASVMSPPDASGKRTVFAVMEAGDVFGEMGLLLGSTVSADVVAGSKGDKAPCEAYVIDWSELLRTIFQDADVDCAFGYQTRFFKFLFSVVCDRVFRRIGVLLSDGAVLRDRREAREARASKLDYDLNHDLASLRTDKMISTSSDEFGEFNMYSLG
jgi:Cyclic nucleotide-binding domain